MPLSSPPPMTCRGPHLTTMAYLWAVMMLCWLGGLLFGVWWVWPLIEAMRLTTDLVLALAWLIGGGVAWLVALNIGLQRYWRR